MNVGSHNFQLALLVLHFFKAKYILEVNAPFTEDNSDRTTYEMAVKKAYKVICVSAVLAKYLSTLNPNVIAVANGGKKFNRLESRANLKSHHFLFLHNSHWPWQTSAHLLTFASKLVSMKIGLKVIDIAGTLNETELPENIEIQKGALSPLQYNEEVRNAFGFYLAYNWDQDEVLDFYLDSLKFRDFWNTNKPIVISGPLMTWAPNDQSEENGIFPLGAFESGLLESVKRQYKRQSYHWEDACQRILDFNPHADV
ncbi:MAG: hypothetical protein O2990_03755 [Bacteroidetes bacterium]|nr:hypothetical protein [Bacteroidota bacterium]